MDLKYDLAFLHIKNLVFKRHMSNRKTNTSLHDRKYIIGYVIFAALYFAWYGFIVGLSATNYGLFAFLSVLFFASKRSRQFLWAFLPFVIYLMIYDSNRILHDYNIFPVHNQCLYNLEVDWFGVMFNGSKVSLNEYFLFHKHSILDFISGIFYISWVPFPLYFAILMFFKGKAELTFRFWIAFLITNLFGFCDIYCLTRCTPLVLSGIWPSCGL